jgi:biopolymer transport protein ExbD
VNEAKIIMKIKMRRTSRRRLQEPKPFDSSSIADLAFLLLIFFIVTSSFILRQGIFLSLPSKSAGAVRMDEKKILEVYPQNNGFSFDDSLLNREEFSALLLKHKSNYDDGVVVVYMADTVQYDRLVDTLSVARETGIERISLKGAGSE